MLNSMTSASNLKVILQFLLTYETMGICNYSDLKVFQCLVKVFNVNFSFLLVLH